MLKEIANTVAFLGLISSLSAQSSITEWDPSVARFSHAGGMKFDSTPGTLEISDFRFKSLIGAPKSLGGISIIPIIEFSTTVLRFDGVPKSFPVDPTDLHSFNIYPSVIGLSTFIISNESCAPWIYGIWAREQLATDFRDVGSDDFTSDLAAGIGYQFSKTFSLGIGGGVINLNGNVETFPGLGFDWKLNDQIQIQMLGPEWSIGYRPDQNWRFGIRGDSSGEIWNIRDGSGKSRSIDLSSYQVGMFVDRHLTGGFWLNVGAGATIGNEIGLTSPHGKSILTQKLDPGLFGQISLSLKIW